MARADQGIQGRATPRSKSRSTFSSKPVGATNATAGPSLQVSKAAKRAAKRAELVKNVASTSVLQLDEQNTKSNLSKSSLKRLKRRQKEQLAGNKQGMKDLETALESDTESLQDEDQEQPAGVGSRTGPKNGAVTDKKKRNVLAHEMSRQSHILSDPAYAKNPFAALRLHAQNTLAFDAGSRTVL